jgi:hypothetical protein
MNKVFILLLILLTACSSGAADEVSAPEISVASDTAASDSGSESSAADSASDASGAVDFLLEAWADNWFAAYLENDLIVEDSVSITTERSFNAETASFSSSYPLQLNFILKDFKENDTGLEYIGANNQQMGDGGFIFQITDQATGAVVAVSSSAMSCLVIHEAPLDKACESSNDPQAGVGACTFSASEESAGWKAADYDDSAWFSANVYSESAVGPKDGYDQIDWAANAELIWGPDLETSNTILCRLTVIAP